jgi:hypothetical protein
MISGRKTNVLNRISVSILTSTVMVILSISTTQLATPGGANTPNQGEAEME